ncbi:MAG: hypothetical protein EBU49_10605 [Proteobacteria bacterium]|nr:hypothetical protein [Pseudomonadota bacterium]
MASSASLISLATLAHLGCVPLYQKASEGLQEEFASHIPARTAVLPCQTWRYVELTPSDRKILCDRMDESVMDGFRAQPYMRGFSPKVVDKLLDQAKWPTAVPEGFAIILDATSKPRCITKEKPMCAGVTSLYADALKNNAAWQMWLARFSDAQKHADAVLIPILVAAADDRGNDRGLIALSRSVHFSMWLVDTSTGKLIWARSKSGIETVRALPERSANLKAPEWNEPIKRALTQDFWRDYPGRLVLD